METRLETRLETRVGGECSRYTKSIPLSSIIVNAERRKQNYGELIVAFLSRLRSFKHLSSEQSIFPTSRSLVRIVVRQIYKIRG